MSSTRKPLVTVDKVYVGSLPRSLRHLAPGDALNDAKAITCFLSHVTDAFAEYSNELDAEAYRGMSLVYNLLMDKLEIGDKSYKFPLLTWQDDAPALIDREA